MQLTDISTPRLTSKVVRLNLWGSTVIPVGRVVRVSDLLRIVIPVANRWVGVSLVPDDPLAVFIFAVEALALR
jgi:hypothetical protein